MKVFTPGGFQKVSQIGGGGGGATFSAGISTQGNTAGTTGFATDRMLFVGSDNITLSQSVNGGSATLTIWGAAGGGLTNIRVSAGTTSNLLSAVTFSNANGVSFGLNASTITGSVATSLTNVNISAGTTSNNLSALVFSNANNVSFGLNGSTVTATATVVSTQGSINLSAGTTSNLASAFTFSNANGLSFGLNAGTITGSYTVPTVTNSSWTASDSVTSMTIGRLAFTNLNGVTLTLSTTTGGSATLVGSHNALTSQSNQALSAPNGSFTFQTAQFHNSNGISWSTTTGSGIIASHNGLTTQTNQQMTMFATGNTTLSSTGTSNASSLIFRGSGAASVGITNGSVLIDVAAGAAAITQSIGISTQTAGGATAGTSGYATGDDILYHFVPGSNITMSQSLNGASATLSIYAGGGGGGGIAAGVSTFGNTAGSTGTVSTGNFILVGTGGISLSQSTGAAGSDATITISAESVPIASFFKNYFHLPNTQTQTVGNSTSVMIPFMVHDNKLSFSWYRQLNSNSIASTSFASTGNTSYSYNQALTFGFQLYTKMTGASSLSLGRIGSTTAGMTYSVRLSRNTTNNISVSHGVTFPQGIGTTSTSFSYAATNSSDQFSTTGLTLLTGVKQLLMEFASSLTQGKYFLLTGYSTTQTTQQTAALSAHRLLMSFLGASQPNLNAPPFAAANNAIYQLDYLGGPGSVTIAGGATTTIMEMTRISSSASHVLPWFALEMYP